MDPYVLVVEDEPDVREMLCYVLQDFQYEAVARRDGSAALEYLRSHAPPFLILLDRHMPVMDGRQFRARQMEDPALASIPVVLLSGEEGDLRDVKCLSKPINVDQLLEIVQAHYERAPRPTGSG